MRQLFQAQKLQLLYSVCFRQFVIAKHSQSFNLGVQYIISSQQAFVPLPLCGTPIRFGHLLLCFGSWIRRTRCGLEPPVNWLL